MLDIIKVMLIYYHSTHILLYFVNCGGVDKCDLCHFHLNGTYRRGSRCTYAHSWAERIEWTCPICIVDGKFAEVATYTEVYIDVLGYILYLMDELLESF